MIRKLFFYISALSIIFSIGSPSVTAASLPTDDTNSIYNDTVWYKPGTGTSAVGIDDSCTSDTSLTGSDNIQKVYNFLAGKGLPAAAVAGIIGNLQQESGQGILPNDEQTNGSWEDMSNDSGHAVGIAQWDGSRRPTLINNAESNGLSLQDLKTNSDKNLSFQLSYFWTDLTQNYSGTYSQMQSETDPVKAATDFNKGFEGGTDPIDPQTGKHIREENAQKVYNQYNGTSGGSSSSSGNCIIGTSTDCTTVTGDPKILCEAEKYQGIYYEWGGGHPDTAAYIAGCPDPTNPPNNQPSGGPVNGDPAGLSGNPSPCGIDCSGLVSAAVDEAFNLNYNWGVSGSMQGEGAQYWKSIPISSAQPGDIVTTPEHVEIVVSVNGNNITTFGAHQTGTQTGTDTNPLGSWPSGAWRWTGPGSNP